VFAQIAILAPGLLGASIAQTLRERGSSARLHLWARRASIRQELAQVKWCDRVAETPEECVQGADLVILCPPVNILPAMLEQIAPHCKEGCLVTDVGSVKQIICQAGANLSSTSNWTFIGSHPMAGSEKAGHAHATPNLFQGRICIVTPQPNTSQQQLQRLISFWQSLGMTTVSLTPEEHDKQVAYASHLPHLTASALASYLLQHAPDSMNYSGQGLRDTTRIAAGDPDLWNAIFQDNRQAVLQSLDGLIRELTEWRGVIQKEDWSALQQRLSAGKQFRDSLS
jgi:prephenate dehydrogenase